MSTLTLVRHGQARPFEKDSDRLSALGEQQAQALGDFWRQSGIRFDEVVCGTLTRHRQTLVHAGLGAAHREDAGWNEYDATAILNTLAPMLAERDAEFAAARAKFAALAGKDPLKNRFFQKTLERLMDAWLMGEVSASGVEPFAAYRGRVLAAWRRIVDDGAAPGGRNVVVFTSGGPIGLCIQHVLRAPDTAFLDLNWRVRNGSLTEFTFARGGRVSLDSFNTLGHLDRHLWTWR